MGQMPYVHNLPNKLISLGFLMDEQKKFSEIRNPGEILLQRGKCGKKKLGLKPFFGQFKYFFLILKTYYEHIQPYFVTKTTYL